jgi:hypothetical protein
MFNNIYKTLIDLTCSDNTTEFSLLIQHIKDAKKLHDCLNDQSIYEFEIFFILFQIYYTLGFRFFRVDAFFLVIISLGFTNTLLNVNN